jgi:hypothetical protein
MENESMPAGATGVDKDNSGRNEQRESVATWIATAFACAYIVWNGASLYYATSVFVKMFIAMNLNLHDPVLAFVANYRWLYPILFGGAMVLVIAKQFFVRNKIVSLTVTFCITVAVAIMGDAIVKALYHPMFDMIQKLS